MCPHSGEEKGSPLVRYANRPRVEWGIHTHTLTQGWLMAVVQCKLSAALGYGDGEARTPPMRRGFLTSPSLPCPALPCAALPCTTLPNPPCPALVAGAALSREVPVYLLPGVGGRGSWVVSLKASVRVGARRDLKRRAQGAEQELRVGL